MMGERPPAPPAPHPAQPEGAAHTSASAHGARALSMSSGHFRLHPPVVHAQPHLTTWPGLGKGDGFLDSRLQAGARELVLGLKRCLP